MSNKILQAEVWSKKLKQAEDYFGKYYDVVRKTREAYKGSGLNNKMEERYNILWSSIETLKPFLYFKQPQAFVERKNKCPDEVERLACKMLEKALEWDLEQFDFDSIIKYARNDFLISGMGIVWEQYKPQFIEIASPEAECEDKDTKATWAIKTAEKVESVYIDPESFICDCDKVGIWENVEWIARKINMTLSRVQELFPQAKDMLRQRMQGEDDSREICIYEIWDKPSQKVMWLCKEAPYEFLRVSDNPLKLSGFFPCPKPIMATTTNDSIIPEPDYCMIKEMISELNGVTTRMRLTMQALKVSGAYDKSFPELHAILDKDVTLVAVSDFQKLKDCGGIKGIIDFAPIEQYVIALEALAKRRDDIVESIFEVTGVSDIMRGVSNANDTATAVTKKTNFGTLRNQDRQNDMQRFIRDLYKIKAEIICEQFATDLLVGFLSEDERQNVDAVYKAVALLRQDKLRGMVLGIETDTVFNPDGESEKILTAVKTINELVTSAFDKVSAQPALLPLYAQLIGALVAAMPKARQFETVLESTFKKIETELSQPVQQSQPVTDNTAELAKQQMAADYEIAKEKNQLKTRELDLKERQQDIEIAKSVGKTASENTAETEGGRNDVF